MPPLMRAALLGSLLAISGCGTLDIRSTPNAAMREWMAAVSTWQIAVTQRINDHERRLEQLEAAHANP